MESNHVSLALPPILFFIFLSSVSADINQDKAKCANQLVGLATCLPYVGGEAKSPTVDCCTGLKQVLKNSKECLCILVKDRNDPSLGLKINATLALALPEKCHAPANVSDLSQCPALLHLPPNSPEAKVFEDFAKAANGTQSSAPTGAVGDSTAKGSSADVKGDAGKRWKRIEMLVGFLVALLVHVLIN